VPTNAWLTYAGTELINSPRTRTYVREMLPTLNMPMWCEEEHIEEHLPVLLDDDPYSNPRVDEAPWYDPDDPDSANFCGLLPISISGLEDSTRTGNVVESTTHGGTVTGQRFATKEVRVTALLIGIDRAAVEAGRAWLTMALGGSCGDPCGRNSLCFLSSVPDSSLALGDYYKTQIQLAQLTGEAGRWNLAAGTFAPANTSRALATPPAPEPLACDEIFWHWTVTALAGTELVFEAVADSGIVFTQSFFTSGQQETFVFSDKGLADRQVLSRFRVIQDRTVTVHKVEIEQRLPADPATCFEQYMRQLRDVSCITGPVTIAELGTSVGHVEQVEFGFVAGRPWVYGAEQVLVDGNDPINELDSLVTTLPRTVAICAAPKQPALVTDPDCPPIPAPPRSIAPAASCVDPPDYYEPYAVLIPDDRIPLWKDVVPVLSVMSGSQAIRAIRIRLMPRPLPTQLPEDLDPCSACGQFVIDYVPPNSSFTLNGMEERAFITQPGDVVTSADHLLSGISDDELFEWPTLSCGSSYYVLIDVAVPAGGSGALTSVGLSLVTRQ
jgi:hypothetical protein